MDVLLKGWWPLLWLVGSLSALLLLERWLNRHLQAALLLITGRAEAVLYLQYLLLLPGILLHEASHWLAAQMLGVRTHGFSLLPRRGRGRQVRYGSVRVGAADPLRHSLIGLAPLLAGSGAVLLCATWGLGVPPLRAPASWPELFGYLRAPDAPLWLYLIFAISNAMLPSASDRQPWRAVLIFLGGVTALLLVTGLVALIPAGVARAAFSLVSYLAYALTLTVAVDLLFAPLIWAVEGAASFLTGRRVRY